MNTFRKLNGTWYVVGPDIDSGSSGEFIDVHKADGSVKHVLISEITKKSFGSGRFPTKINVGVPATKDEVMAYIGVDDRDDDYGPDMGDMFSIY